MFSKLETVVIKIFYQKPGMGRQGPWNISLGRCKGRCKYFWAPSTCQSLQKPLQELHKPHSTCEASVFITIWQVRKEVRRAGHLSIVTKASCTTYSTSSLITFCLFSCRNSSWNTQSVFSLLSAFAQAVTVSFMCHLDWPTGMRRYLVRHYSRCDCESVFGWN